ncbi:hypothetical protein BC833DRAFT_600923 [Globomyces pollinis-pini]|nr:hypothetical protein BC833DRAFT_600923 [Globomyces pollinis-pini]
MQSIQNKLKLSKVVHPDLKFVMLGYSFSYNTIGFASQKDFEVNANVRILKEAMRKSHNYPEEPEDSASSDNPTSVIQTSVVDYTDRYKVSHSNLTFTEAFRTFSEVQNSKSCRTILRRLKKSKLLSGEEGNFNQNLFKFR